MKTPEITNFNYAIGLILYHPEKTLLERVKLITELGISLYIFDNSPEDEKYTEILKKSNSIHYITAGKNVGISYSLMMLCASAHAHGHQNILYLDQDTGISHETLKFINNYSYKLLPKVHNEYVAITFNGKISNNSELLEVPLAISSGSLFNLPQLKKLGWHNKRYFVDCVDYELCVRARRSGLKIGSVSNTPDFDHVSEQPDREINFLGKKILIRKYSSSRIIDAISAYLKLIIGGLNKNKPKDSLLLIKSMFVYLFGQLASRTTKEK